MFHPTPTKSGTGEGVCETGAVKKRKSKSDRNVTTTMTFLSCQKQSKTPQENTTKAEQCTHADRDETNRRPRSFATITQSPALGQEQRKDGGYCCKTSQNPHINTASWHHQEPNPHSPKSKNSPAKCTSVNLCTNCEIMCIMTDEKRLKTAENQDVLKKVNSIYYLDSKGKLHLLFETAYIKEKIQHFRPLDRLGKIKSHKTTVAN